MNVVWRPAHFGPSSVRTDRRGDVTAQFSACGEEMPERHMVEVVALTECEACLEHAAENPDDFNLSDCPTVGDLVEETDATREVVLAVTGFYLSARRVTATLPDRGDEVIVMGEGEREDLVEEILAYVDEEVDE